MKPSTLLLSTCACLMAGASTLHAQSVDVPPCRTVQAAEPVRLSVGKSIVWKPAAPVRRVVLGNPDRVPAAPSGPSQSPGDRDGDGAGFGRPASAGAAARRPGVADVDLLLLSPGEIVLQARTLGSTNFVLVDGQGRCTALDVIVDLDTGALQALVERLLPAEREIRITPAFDAVVLTGSVSDSEALARVTELSQAFLRSHDGGGSGDRRLVNLLEVGSAQQVMLEVKVAEVSKALIDKLGVELGGTRTRGQWTYSLLADFLSGGAGVASLGRLSGSLGVTVDGQKDDALVKVLAEPTVMALSGQTGSFLAGGKIFIPVAQDTGNGGRSVTLEEKEFGVSLRFTPTVLGNGRIHLKVRPEVSEINREGIGIVASGVSGTSVLPSFTSRKAETTVQLLDGQSFAIGGLIRHNDSASVKAFPFLGELPVIGALFRSTEFQSDRSELVFVITPRLVKPLPANYRLPTDGYVPPTRSQLMGHGQLEGAVRSDDALRWLNRAQRQDPQASERRGQTVAPVDARVLPARPGAVVPGAAVPSGPPSDRPPLLLQP
jgi:pilus assembly protein CpaC